MVKQNLKGEKILGLDQINIRDEEIKSINSLSRVYAKYNIKKNSLLMNHKYFMLSHCYHQDNILPPQ